MKLLLNGILALVVMTMTAMANDISDNGECIDEIVHYQHLLTTTSASAEDIASSKALKDSGNAERISNDEEACETAYTSAIDLIK